MDPRRFDTLTKSLTISLSRRLLVGGSLGAVVLGALGLGEDGQAKKVSAEHCLAIGEKCPKTLKHGKKKVKHTCEKRCCTRFSVVSSGGKRRCACREGGTSCSANTARHCCSGVCNGGVCAPGTASPSSPCPSGFARCGNQCVFLAEDRNNCGGCGTVCPETRICCGGTCLVCKDAPANASPACVAGRCDFSCNPGFCKAGGRCNPCAEPCFCQETTEGSICLGSSPGFFCADKMCERSSDCGPNEVCVPGDPCEDVEHGQSVCADISASLCPALTDTGPTGPTD